jgi:6,7-dimethyl-8-ribityllumazine synthase
MSELDKKKNLSEHNPEKIPSAKKMRFGIVVSEWNPEVTESLKKGAINILQKYGTKEKNIKVIYVPGSFELPLGAQLLAESNNYNAIIILGCVIQGETRHFDFICQGVTSGIMNLNLKYNIPFIYGLLTTNSLEQALDRAGGKHGNKGDEAAITAIKMAALIKDIVNLPDK